MNNKLIVVLAIVAISIGLMGLIGPLLPNMSTTTDSAVLPKSWIYARAVKKGDKFYNQDIAQSEAETLSHQCANSEFDFVNWQPAAGSLYATDHSAGDCVIPSHIVQPNDPDYITLSIAPKHIPYKLDVNSSAIVGAGIHPGSLVDVIAIISASSPESGSGYRQVGDEEGITVAPVLEGIKVLSIETLEAPSQNYNNSTSAPNQRLLLELTQKQMAKLTIAKRISDIEITLSLGVNETSHISASSRDVHPNASSVIEMRGNETRHN
ncbi:TPA: Flp pilus assembly protein CpaB [Vibrio vulnificus]|nr:Flp pilus assembly protein CpaB [Vibrio vulnificus]HDY8012850.1 Flp pilus assembly protein CpaB [Vibrio vulnificus]